eukprot:scaffold92623_cov19-Prasinocladus_malaysianus.AAC.2
MFCIEDDNAISQDLNDDVRTLTFAGSDRQPIIFRQESHSYTGRQIAIHNMGCQSPQHASDPCQKLNERKKSKLNCGAVVILPDSPSTVLILISASISVTL